MTTLSSFFIHRNCSSAKNLIDHIVGMLEKYANNLEKIVDERTQQVVEEAARADRLLSQLLPPYVNWLFLFVIYNKSPGIKINRSGFKSRKTSVA